MKSHGSACACCTDQLIPTFNESGKKVVPNPLRRDPSRTGRIRRAFLADINRYFAKLRREIRQLVVEEDAFGLKERNTLKLHAEPRRWQFLTSDKKVPAFGAWLQEQMHGGLLALSGDVPWTQAYVDSAYKQGLVRAWIDTHRKELTLTDKPDFYAGSQAEFLRSSFGSPEALSKIKLIGTRTYESLKGVSASMSSAMSRTLASGLADGLSVYEVARRLQQEARISERRARMVARTEIMHAHAEGQLDSLEALGVEEVGVLVEWSTAGDERVCPLCQPLQGTVLTIKEARGKIPRHPNCRCTWIPANVSEKEKGQKRRKSRIKDAIKKSLRRETKAKTGAEAKRRSTWAGADLNPSTKASQYD